MNKTYITLATLLSLFALNHANAGLQYPNEGIVKVITTGNYIYVRGVPQTAVDSADNVSHIGCTKSININGASMRCAGRNAQGEFAYCTSTEPKYMDAVNILTEQSYISFSRTTSSSECRNLYISNSSIYLRKSN